MNADLDILHREEYIEILKNIIDGVSAGKKSSVFAIDGKWGIGKSFIIDKLNKEIDKSKYVIFNYNCWQYDYYEEPLVAIISNIQDNIESCREYYSEEYRKEHLANKGMEALYSVANSVFKKYTNVDFQEIGNNALGLNKNYDKNNSFKKIIEELQNHLKNITETIPIIFIIDELDRCMPEYAIKVLERIHHIFHGFKNVIVLLSVDRTQLDYSIKKIFGDNTDIDGYLKKFVDFTIKIDNGIMANNWQEKFSADFFNNFKIDNIDIIKLEVDPYLYFLNIREKEKIFNKINVINSSIKGKNGYVLDEAVCIFEIIYAIGNEKFRYDNSLNWLKEGEGYINSHLFKFENISQFNNNSSHELDDKIKEFYSLIFDKKERSIRQAGSGIYLLRNGIDNIWYGLFYYTLHGKQTYEKHMIGQSVNVTSEFEKYFKTVDYVKKMYSLL